MSAMSTAPSTLYVPQDVVETLLQFLPGDLESLRCCALVGRSWIDPAQSLIFRKVTLGYSDTLLDFEGIVDLPPLETTSEVNLYAHFHALLLASPHLARHIRSLHIGIYPVSEADLLESVSASREAQEIERYLLESLPLLCGKGLITLGVFPYTMGDHPFRLLPRIAQLLQSLGASSLQLFNWSFPDCSDFAFLGGASFLHWSFIRCSFSEHQMQLTSPLKLSLTTLEVHHAEGLAAVFWKYWVGNGRRGVRDLVLVTGYAQESAEKASDFLLNNISLFSRSVKITIDHVSHESPPLFTFNRFSHLQEVHLTFEGQVSMVWLLDACAGIVLPPKLTLHLTVREWFGRQMPWELALQSILASNASLRLDHYNSQPYGASGRKVEYIFTSLTT
ncbi:hypothetical protein R3P38DRAFT_2974439 [Favolaschia claudopus]|uniref:F-box domain-containing protein n=1 Tax=Favolaschia claudopus TaxID=2862362 RepID=A0AAW0B4L9_9AGAR